MHPINFFTFDHNFCEAKIYSNEPHPEYFNAFSSLFISFIGLNALFKSNSNFFLRLLYSSLTINGISSFLYHLTNNIGSGLLDRMSMILIAISSTYLFFIHIHRFIKYDKWKRVRRIVIFCHLLVSIYFTILFTIAGLHMESVFNILFSLFLISLVIFMYLIQRHHISLQIHKEILNIGWKGIKYISLSGIFWILTENLCDKYIFIRYFFGHVWWHIFVSLGGYYLSLVPHYILLKHKMEYIIIKKDRFYLPYLYGYNRQNIEQLLNIEIDDNPHNL